MDEGRSNAGNHAVHLFDPIDQVSLLILDKTGYGDAHLLSPGIALSDLNFRDRCFFPLNELLFRFPARKLFPMAAVLRIQCLKD